jgi:hypothetical protein
MPGQATAKRGNVEIQLSDPEAVREYSRRRWEHRWANSIGA